MTSTQVLSDFASALASGALKIVKGTGGPPRVLALVPKK